jgi:hypothetical protein
MKLGLLPDLLQSFLKTAVDQALSALIKTETPGSEDRNSARDPLLNIVVM